MATWFLAPLARLSAAHDIDFDLHRDDQNFTARLLESGTVMAAVTSEESPVSGCSVSPLGVLEYRAMAEPGFAARWFPDGPTSTALAAAPFVDFDRRDTLQHEWLRAMAVAQEGVPRHYVPASHDYALAVTLGLGWGMVPLLQESAGLVPLGDRPCACSSIGSSGTCARSCSTRSPWRSLPRPGVCSAAPRSFGGGRTRRHARTEGVQQPGEVADVGEAPLLERAQQQALLRQSSR